MEKIIAEFKAKSLFIPSLGRGMFFSWDLFTNTKSQGVTIDANALADPSRNLAEVVKIAYLCFKRHEYIASKLGLPTELIPDIGVVEAWFVTMPDEATQAINYIHAQLIQNAGNGNDVKKNSPPKSNENKNVNSASQTLSNMMRRLWSSFSCGNAN